MGVRRGVKTGANPGGAIEAIAPTETYELTLFTMIVYIRKTAFAIRGHLSSIVLPQKCCEVYFISLKNSELVMRLDQQILLKSPP